MKQLQKHIIRLMLLLSLLFVLPQAYGKSAEQSYQERKEVLKREYPYHLPIKESEESNIVSLIYTVQSTIIYIVVFIFVAAIIVFCISYYSKRRHNSNKSKMDEDGIDINQTFTDEELEELIKAGDFKEAIKIVYIRTIQLLNNQTIVHWAPYKTPIDYYYEVKKTDVKKELMGLTSIMLAVRYGNTIASMDDYKKASDNYNEIKDILL